MEMLKDPLHKEAQAHIQTKIFMALTVLIFLFSPGLGS